MARTVLQASLLVSLALLLSRLSGLFREQAIAARLGIGPDTDAVVVLLTLPDLMTALLFAGGFSAALVPALSATSAGERVTLLRRVAFAILAASVLLTGVVWWATNPVLGLLAPSLDLTSLAGFTTGFQVSLLALPLAAVIGVCSAFLQADGRAAVPGIAVLVFNCVLIFYFAAIATDDTLLFLGLALALIGANALRLAVQLFAMKHVFRTDPVPARFDPGFTRQFAQGVLTVSLSAAVPVVFRSLTALGGPGELAGYSFAMRLFDLPVALMIAPVNLVFLPMLAHLAQNGSENFAATALTAIRSTFAITLAAAVTCFLFSEPIAAIVYGYGALAGDGTDEIAGTLRVIICGLPMFAVYQSCSIVLNSRRRTGTVFVCAALALAAALILWWGALQAGKRADHAGAMGFVFFQLFAAGAAIIATGDKRFAAQTVKELAVITLRILPFVICAFFLLWLTGGNIPPLMAVPLAGLLFAALVCANLPVFRRLAAVRSSRQTEA